MSVILITGGNKGLGYETAKELLALGHQVYIACRNQDKGNKTESELGCRSIVMDVTDDESVHQAYDTLSKLEDHIDVLINNAGVSGIYKGVADITGEDMYKVYNTNVFGIVRVTNAFIPLLNKSENPVIVNLSSGLGSFGIVTDPQRIESKINSLTYCSAKASVSMLTLQYAKGLKNMKVNCVDPQATATDLNGGRGGSVEEGCRVIVQLATIGRDGPTGTFWDKNGIIPW